MTEPVEVPVLGEADLPHPACWHGSGHPEHTDPDCCLCYGQACRTVDHTAQYDQHAWWELDNQARAEADRCHPLCPPEPDPFAFEEAEAVWHYPECQHAALVCPYCGRPARRRGSSIECWDHGRYPYPTQRPGE